jgi:hypothetical protein
VKDNLPDHHRRPTSVGENPGSDLAVIVALIAIAATSVAASSVAAGMTHRTGDSLFHGVNMIYAWGAWIYQTINVNGFYVPGQHVNHLTGYGWAVIHGIEFTWGAGAIISLAIFILGSRLSSPKSKQDVREIKDSARMSSEADYREAGFLPD